MRRRKKITILSAIVASIGIILILIVIWMISQEHRFIKYENIQEGFAMIYPSTWTLTEGAEGTAAMFLSPKENDLDYFKENVNIIIQDLKEKPMMLEEYSKIAIHQVKVVFEQNVEVLESAPTYFAGQPAHKFVYIGKGPEAELKLLHIWTIKNRKAYQLTYTALSSKFDQYFGKVNRMIKSFKID
jgi:eukaryotic-like serine/threonine-protein kinase